MFTVFLKGPDDPKPVYSFELTTPSFTVNNDGILVVNQPNLDRDPPNPGKYRFQVRPFVICFLNII